MEPNFLSVTLLIASGALWAVADTAQSFRTYGRGLSKHLQCWVKFMEQCLCLNCYTGWRMGREKQCALLDVHMQRRGRFLARRS